MLATGGLLVSIAVLTLAAVAPVFRSSNPPRWATRGWIGELVTLVIVCSLAVGIGYLAAGAIEAFTAGIDYLDLGLLGVVLLVAVVIWRQWKSEEWTALRVSAVGLYLFLALPAIWIHSAQGLFNLLVLVWAAALLMAGCQSDPVGSGRFRPSVYIDRGPVV